MAWTTPVTRATGYVVLASDWNNEHVNNLKYLHGDAGGIGVNDNFGNGANSAVVGAGAGAVLVAAGQVAVSGTAAGSGAFTTTVASDATDYRFSMYQDGTMKWGPGNAARDTTFSRTAVGVLGLVGNGLGYATGSGASITQITSKTTGVTINAPCGKITTHTESMAVSVTKTFIVTNSAVAATDTIILNFNSTPAGLYILMVNRVVAGAFNITIHNMPYSSTQAEALVINFAVLKAVIT